MSATLFNHFANNLIGGNYLMESDASQDIMDVLLTEITSNNSVQEFQPQVNPVSPNKVISKQNLDESEIDIKSYILGTTDKPFGEEQVPRSFYNSEDSDVMMEVDVSTNINIPLFNDVIDDNQVTEILPEFDWNTYFATSSTDASNIELQAEQESEIMFDIDKFLQFLPTDLTPESIEEILLPDIQNINANLIHDMSNQDLLEIQEIARTVVQQNPNGCSTINPRKVFDNNKLNTAPQIVAEPTPIAPEKSVAVVQSYNGNSQNLHQQVPVTVDSNNYSYQNPQDLIQTIKDQRLDSNSSRKRPHGVQGKVTIENTFHYPPLHTYQHLQYPVSVGSNFSVIPFTEPELSSIAKKACHSGDIKLSHDCNRIRYTRKAEFVNFLNNLNKNSLIRYVSEPIGDNIYKADIVRFLVNKFGECYTESREGMCPYCPEISFHKYKDSKYSQHVSFYHGINERQYIFPNPRGLGHYLISKPPNENRVTMVNEKRKDGAICPSCHQIIELGKSATTAKCKFYSYYRHFRKDHTEKGKCDMPITFTKVDMYG